MEGKRIQQTTILCVLERLSYLDMLIAILCADFSCRRQTANSLVGSAACDSARWNLLILLAQAIDRS